MNADVCHSPLCRNRCLWYEALFVTALAARGLTLREEEAGSTAPRQLTLTDDDGNCIKFFEDPMQPTA